MQTAQKNTYGCAGEWICVLNLNFGESRAACDGSGRNARCSLMWANVPGQALLVPSGSRKGYTPASAEGGTTVDWWTFSWLDFLSH